METNEWKIAGEVFSINELNGEFGASLKIRGTARRPGFYSSSVIEMLCLVLPGVYAEAQKRGLKRYADVVASGHMESWDTSRQHKVYFICDRIEMKK